MSLEEPSLQASQDLLTAYEVGIALVVDLVKGDAHTLISLVKAFVDPLIHLSPQRTHLWVALLPLT